MAGDDVRGYPPRRTPPARVHPAAPPRRFKPQPPHVYKRRRRVAVLLLNLFILLFIRACVPSEHDREMKAWREQADQALQQPLDVGEEIPPSRPVEMRVPSVGLTATFDDSNCDFNDGVLAPATDSSACAFTADDKPYALPGTTSSDIAVLAGSSGSFGPLYNTTSRTPTPSPGDALYLRTQESGERWLRYQATDIHNPDEEGLSQSAAIWGNVPMPGRLLTITSIQPDPADSRAVRYAIVGWQLQDVVPADQAG